MLFVALPTASSFAQNLVQDPGFEDTVIVPWLISHAWQTTGIVNAPYYVGNPAHVQPHSGDWFASPHGTGGTLSQDVTLTKGGRYQFQFYYAVRTGETWSLTASVQGITVFTNTNITNTTMQGSTSVVALTAGSANIFFDASFLPGSGEFGLDDVSLIYLGPSALSLSGLNRNQTAIGTAVNGALAAGVLTPVTDVLSSAADQTEFATALDYLSPEVYNYGLVETLYGSQQFANDLMSCKVAGQDGTSIIREGQCVWVRARARFSDFDHTDANIGARATTGSFSAGAQVAIAPDWHLGFAAGYDSISLSSGSASSEGDRANVGGVIKYNPGPLLLAAGVTGGWGSYDTDRSIVFGDFNETAHGTNDIDYVAGQFHAAYLLQRDAFYLKPLVDVAITNISLDGMTESGGGGAALTVAGTSDTVVSVSPGVEFGTQHISSVIGTIRPFVRAGLTWQDTDRFLLNAGFADAPDVSPFTVSTKIDTVLADVSAGVDIINAQGAALRLQYDGHYAEDTEISSISVKGSAKF
ncbi:autotransporter domain-containing protein [Hyphomicrobium sp. MC1]|uniref:autotransporter outer membrane beta-barrel domain-containing protein n=1 Tax=Hyphomicrobium sp. (strain MC1) TaxID=717785 RepID=UPI0035277BE1